MAENTKTEVVTTENVFLGREHIRFLEDAVEQLKKQSNYKATRSQIIRLLVEGAMRRTLNFAGVTNEAKLRQILAAPESIEPTRIRKR